VDQEFSVRNGKRFARWAALALVVAVAGFAIAAISCAAKQGGAPSQEDKIARGRRVSFTSGCQDCHTPGTFYGSLDSTRMLSGTELGWAGPWGVSYPRNLTPDMETGIGKWSEEDIVTAIRTGHRPDQTPLLPPMPWPMYANLTDEDAYALAAFLKSLPPIVHKAPDVIPPGQPVTGAALVFPPPPEWDARNLPAPPPDSTAKPAG
jgi:mono/diheme cytochrome c family protein